MASLDLDYLSLLVNRFQGYNSPTDAQQLIIALGRKQGRSDDDDKKLAILMRAEKKAEELAQARAKARKMLDDVKGAERKARTRRQIVWGAGILAAAKELPDAAKIAVLAYESGYISAKDKEVIKEEYELFKIIAERS